MEENLGRKVALWCFFLPGRRREGAVTGLTGCHCQQGNSHCSAHHAAWLETDKKYEKKDKTPLHNTQMLYSKLLSLKRKKRQKKARAKYCDCISQHTALCRSIFNPPATGVTPFCRYLHGKEFGSPQVKD